MAAKEDVLRLIKGFEGTVEEVYPGFEKCDPEEFKNRLDIVMRSSVALLAAACASYLRFYGPDAAVQMFTLVQGTLQNLTALNLQSPPEERTSEVFTRKDKLH